MKRDQLLMTSATRLPSKSFIIALLWGLQSCHSFQLIPHHHPSPTSLYSTKSSSTDTDNYQPFNFLQEFSHDNDSSSPPNENSNNGVEIWLDLRGTSLSPSTALELWELEQNDGYSNSYIDDGNEEARKKKGTAPFTKCLVSNDKTNNSNSKSNTEKEMNSNPIQILVDHHHNNNDEPTTTTQQSQQSWGKTLRLQLNVQSTLPILPDPLPAMELVSRGQFVLLDTTGGWKKVEEEERLSFLLPLAELISSGALPAANGSGGIGFTCLTKNEVVKVAMWIQSITNNNQCVNGADGGSIQNVRVKTLDNGLVIPDDSDDDASADLQSMLGTSRQAAIQYAIVVPYDVGLLKTASMLLWNEGF
eukprot:CAMPEP_0201720118 /NCGR_PEP_ID=MMETSP0593-20130828/5141_1 /ASSEMBLY_ACC=CAM_ASM_000672 /TAXON_ID=267983 /ORGANISM="Skeletonema japonicum, Strain CCMP2506" /LENGTH=360 /DNA_ID=CAMNT_0048210699 /DNA_START=18 /DNA_END=1100 /DNA_ORIENTATION=+